MVYLWYMMMVYKQESGRRSFSPTLLCPKQRGEKKEEEKSNSLALKRAHW